MGRHTPRKTSPYWIATGLVLIAVALAAIATIIGTLMVTDTFAPFFR